MRIKSKNFIITIVMLVIILIFFLFYLKAPVTNKTQCPPYVSTKEEMYAAWDGNVVSGSNIITLLQLHSSTDNEITFVIDNGVSKKEYNAFDSALTDRFAADTYIKPDDAYICTVMRNSDDKINMLTFNIVTSGK